jgi:phosphoadenosine phosphosulfate reductase
VPGSPLGKLAEADASVIAAQQRVADLLVRHGKDEAPALLEHMIRHEFKGRIAVTSSFGAEAAVLLDLVAQVDSATPIIFLDTDALFDETLDYVAMLRHRLGLSDLRIVRPSDAALAEADEMWRTDADGCCQLRKVLPLSQAVHGFDALIDGRKRLHGAGRAALPMFQADPTGLIKISPLADWTEEAIEHAFRLRDLPRHPLLEQGYRSIGCWPCTRPISAGESPRAGRWAGAGKTECGIHRSMSEGSNP